MLLTSLSALPASCRCRLFMCEVFFLGTALSTPSQMSDNRPGRLSDIAGIDKLAVDCTLVDNSGRGLDDEIWKIAKLRGASRDSIANAAKACPVAMMDVASCE